MQAKQNNFPVFEANQVLTNAHLNQIFDYLDEQERLTRANLVGIGIVCGLDIALDNPAAPTKIHLGKGCGITSEGYLIIEPDDVDLVAYRDYVLPDDIAYPAFIDAASGDPYPLWELFPAGEAETTPLTGPAGFLDDKAVLLFLELKKSALRNCSPNNCDDKGAGVAVQVRRLLIRKQDLDAIIAAADTESESSGAGLEASLAAQLNLPDLRLPRFDVTNSQPITSNQVLAAFLKVFGAGDLATALATALTAAYQAFKPILQASYPGDPFSDFMTRFGFLDNAPATTNQVRFLPYYYDFFDDLIRAYDDFREQALGLMCACCPAEGLFPRHLLLGLLSSSTQLENSTYRHRFLASPAVGDCEQRTRDTVILFRRLVEMIRQFTDTPALPPMQNQLIDTQIRATPSKLGTAALSDKAIPYYYRQTGSPPLYELWHPEKSRLFKAGQNLGYRADEYVPPAPAFVSKPLAYDLEPYNFLRIEGHLGKNYQTVLNTLLSLKSQYRLPIGVIALRSGVFDESIATDLSKEDCRFQDLEAAYDLSRAQLLGALVKALTYFYHLPAQSGSPVTTPVPSQFALINQYQPGFLVQPQTLGRLFEDYITQQGGTVPDIDANLMASWINIFPPGDNLIYYSFFYLLKLGEALPDTLSGANFADIENRYRNLLIVVVAIETKREQGVANLEGNSQLLNWEEIDDRLEDLLKNTQLDALRAVHKDFGERVKHLKKKQFLSHFLVDHPGIQHKAGVPFGGTFIIVYHQDPPAASGLSASAGFAAATPAIDPFAVRAILPEHANNANLTDFVFRPVDVNFINMAAAASASQPANPRAGDTAGVNAASPAVNPATDASAAAVRPTLNLSASLLRDSLAAGAAANQPAASGANINTAALANAAAGSTLAASAAGPRTAANPSVNPATLARTTNASVSPAAETPALNPQATANARINPAVAAAGTTGAVSAGIRATDTVGVTNATIGIRETITAGAADTATAGIRATDTATINPALIDAIRRLQIQQPTVTNPDLQIVIDGLSTLIPTVPIFPGGFEFLSPADQIIAATVNGFADGTVIADFYLPYLYCGSCTPIQFVLPKPPPTFTFTVACTASGEDGPSAPVSINAEQGLPPYRIKIDDQAFQDLANPVMLAPGEHTLIIQDADDSLSSAQTLTIPQPIGIGEPTFTCTEDRSQYVAVVPITGGTPPYTVNESVVDGDSFTSAPAASGADVVIRVVDQMQCVFETTLTHTCPPPCDLPNDGQSRRSAYRLWLQPSGGRFGSYKQTTAIRFNFNDKEFDLSDTAELLQMPADDLNNDFQTAFAKVIRELNAKLNAVLGEAFERLSITYAPADTDPFGVLMIEHFEGDSFSFAFDFGFSKSGTTGNFAVRYGNDGFGLENAFDGVIFTNLDQDNRQIRVPAFDPNERNQCDQTPFVKACSGFDVKPNFTNQNFQIFTIADDMPRTGIAAWVWDFSAPTAEPFYEGESITVNWQVVESSIRLTAITDKGCFSSNQISILL
ncbi:hypothetical protein [Methylomonas sp. MgM2]